MLGYVLGYKLRSLSDPRLNAAHESFEKRGMISFLEQLLVAAIGSILPGMPLELLLAAAIPVCSILAYRYGRLRERKEGARQAPPLVPERRLPLLDIANLETRRPERRIRLLDAVSDDDANKDRLRLP